MKDRSHRRGRRYRTPLRFDTQEALEVHRELEYLRTCARKPRNGRRRRHQENVERRARKLRNARRDFDPDFRRKRGQDDE